MFDRYYCAPNKNDNISCYDITELEKIAKYINKRTGNNQIIVSKDKKKLHKEISDFFANRGKCNTEYCWKEYMDISQLIDHENIFKPEYPSKWLGPTHQLSTSDIDNVLKQYENKYNNFKYYGALPIDFDLKKNNDCAVSDICDINIEELIKESIKDIGIVFNTDPHTRGGEHWMSMYVDIDGSNLNSIPGIYFFDSYGMKPCSRVGKLINKIKQQGQQMNIHFQDFYNDHKYQNGNYHCGVYSIHFIIEMLKNKSFKKYLDKKVLNDKLIDEIKYQYFIHPKRIHTKKKKKK